jgi:hypothetical protein
MFAGQVPEPQFVTSGVEPPLYGFLGEFLLGGQRMCFI